jgi:L-asparaginase/Glu-tRNA(Gln) amidotransferase subunit D
MAAVETARSKHSVNNHNSNHMHNHAHSVSEIFLRTFRSENGTRVSPVSRTKERESRVLVLYTGGTIGMMKNDKKGMFSVKLLFVLFSKCK